MGSEHFTDEELACRHCGRVVVVVGLLHLLERIRAAAGGRPLPLRSAYRCPEHNRAVGGAPRSLHMQGRAADIPAGFVRPRDARRLGARGVGIQDGWAVHVDVREGAPATWHY